MLKNAVLLFILFVPLALFSQIRTEKRLPVNRTNQDNREFSEERDNRSTSADTVASIDMYKIITLDRDTTFVDTSLTIRHEYKNNYLRKDNFGLLPFANDGQAYNTLDFGLTQFNPFPEFGFRAKHVAYMEVDDINYYNVATPFSDLFYRSTQQQGQILDALATVNTSENLNFSIAYKGLRSLGRYINSLSSNGHFRFASSYNTTDKRYQLKLHFTAQDFTNGENGGIIEPALFESGEDLYTDRERLDVYFRDATSIMKGNRYFVDHTFRLSKDNPNSIVLHHQFNYEHKFFEYTQPTISARFGRSYNASVNNKTRYNRMYNKIGAAYANETIGTIEFYLEDFTYNYFYKSMILGENDSIVIPNSLNDRINTYGARYSYQKDKWKGSVLFSNSITNQSLANIDASARYRYNDETELSFRYQNMNKLPNHNFNLYQSDYAEYNWSENWKNEKINNFEVGATTKWLSAALQYTVLNDYLYFERTPTTQPVSPTDIDTLLVKPAQYGNTINYVSLKLNREFKFGNFALDNTLLYQKVTQNNNILNVPEFTTRNTLYYSNHFFKKALFLQTGVTFQYFTEYYGNDYNPLIAEFYVQDEKKFGGFPLIDFFLNAKIRQFRLFFKAEHFNSSFTGYNFYSAPNYPYRDFTLRLGIIWDFFS